MLGASALASALVGPACILADPPPELVVPGHRRPAIVTMSVRPVLSEKIRSVADIPPPAGMAAFVEVDPDVPLEWRVFVDGEVKRFGTVQPQPQTALAEAGTVDTRTITFGLDPTDGVDDSACHVIQLSVALAFTADNKPVEPPGGDTAYWFFEPVDCALFDAGPVPDAGDAGDGGDASDDAADADDAGVDP